MSRRRIDPVEAQSRKASIDTFKRLEKQHIVRVAEDLERDSQTDGFKHLFNDLDAWLKHKSREFENLKEASVREILDIGETRYLMKRVALEAEIRQLETILRLPAKYQEKARRIKEPPTSETYRRKTKGAKE